LGCARLGRGGEAAQAVRRLVRVAPRFRLGSLRKIRFADAARLQSTGCARLRPFSGVMGLLIFFVQV